MIRTQALNRAFDSWKNAVVKVQINIKTLVGKTITLRVLLSDTIGQVKTMFEDKEGIPTFEQHFFFNGVELENGTLSDYNIENDATLNFIWRGFGGGTYQYLMGFFSQFCFFFLSRFELCLFGLI